MTDDPFAHLYTPDSQRPRTILNLPNPATTTPPDTNALFRALSTYHQARSDLIRQAADLLLAILSHSRADVREVVAYLNPGDRIAQIEAFDSAGKLILSDDDVTDVIRALYGDSDIIALTISEGICLEEDGIHLWNTEDHDNPAGSIYDRDYRNHQDDHDDDQE